MEDVVIERAVELVCTDRHQHPLRELAVVVPVDRRVAPDPLSLAAGVETWDETPDERRGFTVRESLMTIEGELVRKRRKTEVTLRQSRAGKWTIEVRCPTCHRQPRIPMDVLVRYEQRASGPRRVLDVSALGRIHS